MKTISYIIAIVTAVLVPAVTASANDYEDRLNDAFQCIINAAQFTSLNEVHNHFSDPETGTREGKLDLIVFTLPQEGIYLIDAAKGVYEQINRNSNSDKTLDNELYTLWINTANKGNDYSGYRLYYSPEQTILVGNDGGNCYTVGFINPDDNKHRTTYTLEWDNNGSNSIKGRIITTYAPIKNKSKSNSLSYSLEIDSLGVKLNGINIDSDRISSALEKYNQGMEKYQTAMDMLSGEFTEYNNKSFSFSSSGERNAKSWMKKMLFYVNKVQEKGDRYLYLSKLYELCKDTEGLDQTDLKIAMQQLALIYKQLKAKNKLKENELLFLENMVDLLESKIKN